MTVLDMFRQMGVFALMTMVMAVVPLIMAVGYVVAPTERNLALMRPISLAAIFSTLAGVSSGGMAVLRSVARAPVLDPPAWHAMAAGGAESLATVFVGFGCLTVAWLLVALGMRRSA
jgi:hypothetical protein